MAYNTGVGQRFENGGALMIGAASGSAQAVDMIVPHTVDFTDLGRERVTVFDRGVPKQPTPGNQRDDTLVFELWATGVTDTLVGIMNPAIAAGVFPYFYVQVKIPNYDGDTTGETWTSSAAFLANGVRRVPANGPGELDRWQIDVTVRGGWTKATY